MINLRRREDNKRTSVFIEILYHKSQKEKMKISVLHLLEISWLTWSLMLKTFDL